MQVKASGRVGASRSGACLNTERSKRREGPWVELKTGSVFDEASRSPASFCEPSLLALQSSSGTVAAVSSLRRKRQRLSGSASLKRPWLDGPSSCSRKEAALLSGGASRALRCPMSVDFSEVCPEEEEVDSARGDLLPQLLGVTPACGGGWSLQLFRRHQEQGSALSTQMHSGSLSAKTRVPSPETRGVLTAQQQMHKEKMELLLKEQLMAYRRDLSQYAGWRGDGGFCSDEGQFF